MPENPYAAPSSNPSGFSAGAGISPRIIDIMRRTKTWVRLVSVLFFIFVGIQLVTIGGALIGTDKMNARGMGAIFGQGIISLILYLIPALKLHGYAKHIARLMQSGQATDLEAALSEHRGYWKFWGIMIIIFLVLIFAGVILEISSVRR